MESFCLEMGLYFFSLFCNRLLPLGSVGSCRHEIILYYFVQVFILLVAPNSSSLPNQMSGPTTDTWARGPTTFRVTLVVLKFLCFSH